MDLSGFAQAGRIEPAPPTTFTAIVVRADESGLWVAPIGDDTRHPIGPCRGGYTAQGTLAPPGALVVLVQTPDGPWAVGLDNPALAVNDATLAPFPNPSFESGHPDDSTKPAGWSNFWTGAGEYTGPDPIPLNKYRRQLEDGTAVHGLRSYRIDSRGAAECIAESFEWSAPPGSSFEVSVYARGVGSPFLNARLFSNVAGQYPGPFGSGAAINTALEIIPGPDWLRYRGVVTVPPTHSRVNLFLNMGHRNDADPGGESSIWVDNVDVDLVEIDPSAAHQDYLRRATATLAGGGIRTVTAGGNVSWSQPLTMAAAGLAALEAPAGRFEITMPANGTVIPVHHSTARTSLTVTGGVIGLSPNEALWYELPIGQSAASQPSRFHVLASELDDGYAVPPHWILVVRRAAWSATAHAPEYVWGDGRAQDPWRSPSLNAGWAPGTVAPRFTKGPDGTVRLLGRVKDGVGSAFTLPDGYHPADTHDDIVRDGAGTPALITVTAAGVVTTSGNNTDHSINTAFPAGQ